VGPNEIMPPVLNAVAESIVETTNEELEVEAGPPEMMPPVLKAVA
jgi:hypothetical protein